MNHLERAHSKLTCRASKHSKFYAKVAQRILERLAED